jgi:hypothetical protein
MLGRMLCVAVFFGIAAQVAAAQASPEVEATMNKMLAALQTKSLTDFVAGGDTQFRASMTQWLFDGVSVQFASRLKKGYTTTFLGSLNQQGYTAYLWKLQFKVGGDDLLVTMAVKEGKVGGFFLR